MSDTVSVRSEVNSNHQEIESNPVTLADMVISSPAFAFETSLMVTLSPAASATGTSEQTMTIAMNSDSSLRFIDFIKYPSFLMSGGTRPTGQAAMAACRISLRPYYTTRLWKVRIETVSFLHHFLIPAALRAFQPGPMVYWTEKRGGRFPGEGIFFGGGVSPPRSRTPPTAAREAIF